MTNPNPCALLPDNPIDSDDPLILDLDQTLIDIRLCSLLGCVDAIRLGCVPVRRVGGEILVAVMPHTMAQAASELPWILRSPVRLQEVYCPTIARAIQKAFSPLDAGLAAAG